MQKVIVINSFFFIIIFRSLPLMCHFIIIGVLFVGCMDDSYDSASIQNLYPDSTNEQELTETNLYEILLNELELNLSNSNSNREF